MADIRLTLNDLWYEAEGRAVIQAFNLAVSGGEGIGFFDPTGLSGRDLLRICATLLKPTRGGIYLDGLSIPFYKEAELFQLRRKIAYIASDAALISNLTLLQNVSLGWAYHENRSLYEVWPEGEGLLTHFQVGDYGNLRPTAVNAEIRNRTICARELAKKPVLILLDQMVERLSPEGQALFRAYLENYIRETGSSLLVASTSTAFLSSLASLITRSYILKDGLIVVENPAYGRP